MESLYFIIPAIFIGFSLWLAVKMVKKGINKKKAVLAQIFSVMFFMVISLFACGSQVSAVNQTSSSSTSSSSESVGSAKAGAFGAGLIAAALVTGLSGIGGGIAVAAAAPAAIAATSEDPKAFGKSLIFVALGEGFSIYGLLISIMILGKLDGLVS